MNLVLYYAPISCSLVPYIVLSEAGADFEIRIVDFKRAEHLSEDFLRINPKHQVPVLLINGVPLTENVAIQIWVARQFPNSRLLPVGDLDEFKAIELLAWCDSGIHPHLTPNVLPQRYCDLAGSEEGVKRCAHKMLRERYQIAESALGNREWFFDHFTLPDAFFFWCFRRGMQFNVDVTGFPNCRAHFDRVSRRPSVQNLLAFERNAIVQLGRSDLMADVRTTG
jgi:glutathione S-transferase